MSEEPPQRLPGFLGDVLALGTKGSQRAGPSVALRSELLPSTAPGTGTGRGATHPDVQKQILIKSCQMAKCVECRRQLLLRPGESSPSKGARSRVRVGAFLAAVTRRVSAVCTKCKLIVVKLFKADLERL